MHSVKIFTDGGCSGNPGPGAWAYIILIDNLKSQASGSEVSTTNNRMELSAVISALKEIHKHPLWKNHEIEINTDSRYVEQGITNWIKNWEINGWQTRSKKPVKNQALWKELRGLEKNFNISWKWLRGHSGHEFNEACDRMVQEAIKQIT